MAHALAASASSGRERDGHLDFFRLPFLPGAAIEPDFAVFEPGLRSFRRSKRFEDGGQADAVRAVRIGEIAGGVNLVRFELLQQVDR